MLRNSYSKRLSKTAIILSVVLVLLVSALLFIVFYPKIEHYRVLHKNYELYGGMTDELKDSTFYEDLQSGKSVCFLGDSITFGATTNGVPWYQPMVPYIKGKGIVLRNMSCAEILILISMMPLAYFLNSF